MTIAAVAAVIAAPRVAAADEANPHLARARQQRTALHYAAAKRSLDLALAWGKNNPAQLAQIYRLFGELEASLGNREAATIQFRRWLAIAPGASLPAGTSPKLTAPFAAARAYFASHKPLRATQYVQKQPPAVVVSVASDPLTMVAGVRVDYQVDGGPWRQASAQGRGELQVPLPHAARVGVVVRVVDQQGNALVTYGSRGAPMVASTAMQLTPPPTARKSLFARWPVWAGAAAALAAGTTYFALDTHSTQRELDDLYTGSSATEYSQVAQRIADLKQRGERSSQLANAGIAATAVVGVVAIVLAIAGSDTQVRANDGGVRVGTVLHF